jgi:penicillin-binding protein-related factor A (putative recombinase)
MLKQLTKHQFDVLKKLANNKIKTFCVVFVKDQDDTEFNETLQLVETKLLIDISDRYSDLIKTHTDNGNDAAVTALTFRGQWMFERTKWEKWIN